MDKEISLVTGANGHLGNNLVRLLTSKNIPTIATVRNLNNTAPFKNINCTLAQADLLDKASLVKAFNGVTNVYAVGAAFKMWSKNPKRDIYDNNVQGTRNLFEAAAECGVKNIVYVSSVAALDYTQLPAKESNGYNKDRRNWYYNSKNDSDKLAIQLGKKYQIRTVLILPSAMIGAEAHHLSYSNRLVWQIINGEIPADTNITLNWIHVMDVAKGAFSAMENGKNGERYILANEKHTSLQESVAVVKNAYPELGLKIPVKVPKPFLYVIAAFMELGSKITGKEPLLRKEYIDMFYGVHQDFDLSKSKKELQFAPKSSKKALEEAALYLHTTWRKKGLL